MTTTHTNDAPGTDQVDESDRGVLHDEGDALRWEPPSWMAEHQAQAVWAATSAHLEQLVDDLRPELGPCLVTWCDNTGEHSVHESYAEDLGNNWGAWVRQDGDEAPVIHLEHHLEHGGDAARHVYKVPPWAVALMVVVAARKPARNTLIELLIKADLDVAHVTHYYEENPT